MGRIPDSLPPRRRCGHSSLVAQASCEPGLLIAQEQSLCGTCERARPITTVQDDDGYYTAVFANLSRQDAPDAGDVLEIGIDGLVHHKIALEDLRRAFARIDIHPQNVQPVRTVPLQNYPNPLNPETWMPYQLSSDTDVHITIYDINGATVRRLSLGHQGAGFYRGQHRAVYWDGRSETGHSCPVASISS